MSVQAQWYDMSWEISSGKVCSLTDLGITLGIDVEKNDDAAGEPPDQAAKRKLSTLKFTYDVTLEAGVDPMEELTRWYDVIKSAVHAPFYLGGKQLLDCDFMLIDVSPKLDILDCEGNVHTASFDLSFEEWAEEPAGLKIKEAKAGSTPGIRSSGADVSALNITASEDDRIRMGG